MIIKPIQHPDINAEFEVWYTVSSGHSTIIPMSDQWSSVAVQVSGGLDSAVLLYLTAKTIKENKLKTKIRPVSFEVNTKAKTLSSARNVVSKVSEILDFDQWETHMQYDIPIEFCKEPYKNKFFADTIDSILNNNESQFDFNGNTLNPPQDVRFNFKNDIHRQLTRDLRTTIYNGPNSASPHAYMNKKDVVELYTMYNLLNKLSPLTLSCDEDLDIIQQENLPVPCKTCWWCAERAWGFTANGYPIEKSYEYTK